MKKFLAAILVLAMALTFCAGCSEQEESGSKTNPVISDSSTTWTVLMYVCGTDLETDGGAASANFQELLSVPMSDKINFVIQTGGTANWQTEGISSDKLQRYIAADGTLRLVDEQPSASMGDASTLSSFLTWGVQSYPADKTMVLFWNHGGGSAGGVAVDQLYENDTLSLNEIAEGVAAAGITYEVIGFDTCLMATLENADKISSYGKYMVASEEYEPGGGWDYAAFISYLSKNNACSGLDLGKQICDSYFAKCTNAGNGDMATLSVVDLSKIAALSTAFDEMAMRMTAVSTDITSFQTLAKAAVKAENYGGNTDTEGYTNMVDLKDLVSKTSGVLEGTDKAVISALTEAVKYNVNGSNRASASGISVFYPLTNNADLLNTYATVCKSAAYLKFISAFNDSMLLPSSVTTNSELTQIEQVNQNSFPVSFTTSKSEDGVFSLQLQGSFDSVTAVYFSLYQMNGEGQYVLLGMDDDLNGDWDAGSFSDNFRGVWPTIDGSYCSLQIVSQEDTYNIYSIPVLLNGEKTNLRAVYDFNAKTYTVIGSYDGIGDAGMSGRDVRPVASGDKITFLFPTFSDGSEEIQYLQGDTITAGSSLAMAETSLMDGDYLYQYRIIDAFGNEFGSDTAVMSVENGNIYLS